MKKFLCVLLCVALAAPAWGAVQKWAKYVNDRFSYSIEYPDLFSKRTEPENGDGVWMESKDGKTRLTLSGGFNVLMQDGPSMLEERETKGAEKRESGPSWFRLVRREGGRIIHEYGVVNDDTWASFTFAYPKTADFKAAIRRMERSLRLNGNN